MAHMGTGMGTFSIVARDAASGRLGLAVATRVPAVGARCLWARPGLAAVATQGWNNPYLAERLFEAIEAGAPAPQALDTVMAQELDAHMRQVGVVDAQGHIAAHTGAGTEGWAGHHVGEGFTVQGNMLAGAAVIEAMAEAYVAASSRAFALRLLAALGAGDEAGGDRRGKQSAALRVHGAEIYAEVDLRVDDHAEPVRELGRIYELCERELFPYMAALPTRANPKGDFEAVRARMSPGS